VAESPATGQGITGTFEANGRELFIDCIGQGSPTFVLEAGEGVPSDAMAGLKHALAERGTACSYDRANTGRSGSAPTPRTAAEIAADLNALLSAASIPGPYVLVGHSAGGMFVQMYARTFPEDVAGVVAMNPVPPFAEWREQGFPEMTKQERAGEIAYYEGENGESFDYRASSEQIAEAPAPPDMPFEMLISTVAQCAEDTTGICKRTYPANEAIMEAISQEWPDGGFSQVESGHEIYSGDVQAILAIVDGMLVRIQSS
jgi:pimeloyl-ACP methyl ester carboxylesterase